jgi:UDPglucose 6-dehydrogenase
MRLAMVGAGYVGMVSAACLADFGHHVVCIDHDAAKVRSLQKGEIPIYEPGLGDLVRSNVASERLCFATDLSANVADADVVFVAVGTPSRHGDGYADLSYVYAAASEIGASINKYTVVAIKSTVPVGTGDEVERIIKEANPTVDFSVVSNPEFLREGSAILDFKQPDRIVIGTNDKRGREVMAAVYRPLYLNQAPLVFASRRTAELSKYAANAFLAMKITYINEIADLCEKVGANVQDVARAMGLDNRIGSKFLHPGPGYGGSCFPKDTTALVKTAHDFDSPLRLVETTISINDQRRRAMARKIIKAIGGEPRGKTIALLGLTFKPNTDDMREAPSLFIIRALQDAGAIVRAHDPVGIRSAKQLVQNVFFADDPYQAAEQADALVIVTEWSIYRALDLNRIKELLRTSLIVDLRNVLSPDEAEHFGIKYVSVGR